MLTLKAVNIIKSAADAVQALLVVVLRNVYVLVHIPCLLGVSLRLRALLNIPRHSTCL